MRKFYLVLICFFLSFKLFSQNTIGWNFVDSTPIANIGVPVTDLTISDLTRGNNNGTTILLTKSSASSTYLGASGTFNAGAAAIAGSLNTSASGSAYFEFTLTPASSKSITVSAINFGTRSTGTGPVSYALRTSLDAYASDAASGTIIANPAAWSLKSNTTSIIAATDQAITIRIYGYGSASTSVASNTANWRIDDISVSLELLGTTSPTVSVSTGTNAAEPATNGNFTISLSTPAPVGGTIVNYSLSGTATISTDYTDPQSGTVTISEGSNSATININVVDDFEVESSETVILTIPTAPSGYTIGTGSATINIIDNDMPPTVSVSAGANAAEPTTNGNFTISLSTPAPAGGTIVNYSLSGTATISTDYTDPQSGTITIAEGSSSATININVVDNSEVESSETVILTIPTAPSGYTIGTGSATINITDNDVLKTISVSAGINAAEPSTNGRFIISLAVAAPAGGLTITYSLGGTATATSDYTDPLSGTIIVPEGASTDTIILATIDDAVYEMLETVDITLNTVSNGYTINNANASINFTNNDIPPLTPISLTGSIYTQDFDALNATSAVSTNILDIEGWTIAESGGGGRDNEFYAVSNGGSGTGDTYSYGTGTNNERALGSLGSSSLIPTIGAYYKNNTGVPVTSIKIIYTGEQWRLGTRNRYDRLDFEYSTDATSLITGAWTALNSLDFQTVDTSAAVGSRDGNSASKRKLISRTINGLNIPDGGTFFIRWADFDASGADDGLAIDDFSLETNPIDNAAPIIITYSPINTATEVKVLTTASITFDEDVKIGTGTIVIKNATDESTVKTIDVTSADLTFNGDVASFSLAGINYSTNYYIEISSGAFTDYSNNQFAGFTGGATWSFATENSTEGIVDNLYNFAACSGSIPDGFVQYSKLGTQIWGCTNFGINATHDSTGSAIYGLQMNGYSGGDAILNEDWLISPAFDISTTIYPLLSFWSRTAFDGEALKLKVSTDFPGYGDPLAYTWEDINGKFPAIVSDVWTNSKNINLSKYKPSTKLYFAFVYNSNAEDAARWTIDDIKLENSATPPPPSITSSTSSLQFEYTPEGSVADKSFVLTGNDLTAAISLVADAPFNLSTSATGPFTSTLNLDAATYNDLPTTIYVRFMPVVAGENYTGNILINSTGATEVKISLKGTSLNPENTLEIVNWNVEWFGIADNNFGPRNKALQKSNVQTILQNIGADLFALVEIVDTMKLGEVVRSIPGYSYVVGNFGSHSNPFSSEPNSIQGEAQKLAFVYKTSMFTNISTTPVATDAVNTAADLKNPAYNYFASGRYPFMMTADVTVGGVTKTIRFVLLHGKANTAPLQTSYDRRKAGSDTLKYIFDNLYPNDNIILLGDINDDLDQTIAAGINTTVTSYSAFLPAPIAVSRAARTARTTGTDFYLPTLSLSNAGEKSTVSYNDMIDHVIVSDELQPYYIQSTAAVLTSVADLVSNYGSTTSDHYPVFTRYNFTEVVLPVTLINFTAEKNGENAKIKWTTSEEKNVEKFVVERSADGNKFSEIGLLNASGKKDYELIDAEPLSGVNYYRLKTIDADGKFSYSEIAKLNFDKAISFVINPNPTKGMLWIKMEGGTQSTAKIEALNVRGQIVRTQFNSLTNGVAVPLNLTGYSKGIYFIKLTTANQSVTRKILLY